MTSPPQSSKRVDAGRIKGAADIPQVIEIRFQVALPNSKLSFGAFHGYYTTVPASLQTLANSLFSSISSAWSSNLGLYMTAGPPATTFQFVYVRDMTSHLNPVFTSTGAAVLGTSASPAMPPGAAIVLTENIASRGKGLKGRVYLGGWSTNADAGGGQIAGVVQTAVTAFGTAVLNAINGQNLLPCVAQPHRQQYTGITGTVHADRPANHVQVNSYVCRDVIWDSQRRRAQP